MSADSAAPWLPLYPADVDPFPRLPERTLLDLVTAHADADPARPALRYFGRDLSRGEVLDLADRLAAGLAALGVRPGDRVAVALQNTPGFVLSALAAWRLAGIVVPVNPMLTGRELDHLVADCTPRVLVADPSFAATLTEASNLPTVVWSSGTDLAGTLPLPAAAHTPLPESAKRPEHVRLLDLLEAPPLPRSDRPTAPAPADVALLTYTSGTTGPSKGAMSTHANLTYQAVVGRQWFALGGSSSVLATAPLFHITGLGLHLAVALGNGLPLVLTHRFDAPTVLTLLEHYRPTFTVAAITAFLALSEAAADHHPGLAALSSSYSGGAPVPESVVRRYQQRFGVYIHNIYGLTESTSACIAVPRDHRAPVDPGSGALAIGVPLPGTTVTVVDDTGAPVPPGTAGEVVVAGPSVGSGYWNRPEETAHAFRPDGLHTGDVGIMDEHGWVYLVDRLKDLLVVSGYKVWPREVEDVLYLHPDVHEAAVVGRADDYQGQSVHAFATLRPGGTATAEVLREHCRRHLSAYKVPRGVDFLEALPKTATGKILRRQLRADPATTEAAR